MDVFAEKTLNLGETIAKRRKKLGWTQERLAKYLGITKASVSKWETGQTCPHILLLPDLATLFDITIDELLSYESRLSKNVIEHILKQLVSIRETEGIIPSLEKLNYYLRRHGNCPEFLFGTITWLTLSASMTTKEDERNQCFKLALKLIEDIQKLSDDPTILTHAVNTEATIYLFTHEYSKVIAKSDQLLATNRFSLEISYLEALRAKGEYFNLEESSQILLFMHIRALLSILTIYISIPELDFFRFESLFQTGMELIETLKLETVPVTEIFGFYAQGAMTYSKQEQNEKALELLACYVQILKGMAPSLDMAKNEVFNLLKPWIEDLPYAHDGAAIGDNTLHHLLASLVLTNPNLESVRTEPEFTELASVLQQMLKGDPETI